MLDEFTGTLIMVSHDRFMLDRLVDHLIVLNGDGSVELVEGKFTEYLAAKRKKEREQKQINVTRHVAPDRESGTTGKAPRRLSLRERQEYERLEEEVAMAEQKHTDLAGRLEKDASSAGYSLLAEWTSELAKLEADINSKSERWLALAERADIR